MDRTPEPELMTEQEQARAYAQADFTEPHDHFVATFQQKHPALPSSGVALDLGCGPADVTLRMARALPKWNIDGVDGSQAMLDFGVDAVDAAGFQDRVSLHRAFLPDDDAPRPTYDLIFSNSLLHHLNAPGVIWQSVIKYAEKGTPIFVMDLMRPENATLADEMVEKYSGDEPDVLKRDFLYSLHAAYTVDEVRAQLDRAQLDHLQVEALTDRHLVVFGAR